jgi:uncharacterized protein (TIGR02246 family)
MRAVLTILALALVFGLVACAPQESAPVAEPAPDTSAQDEADVRAQVDALVAAWNAGDFATIEGMMHDDVIQMPQTAVPMKGRDAVLAHMKEGYDPSLLTQTATIEEVETMGDFALAFGTWALTPTEAAGSDAEGGDGTWMVLYKRSDAGWLTYRWIWNQYTQ